MMNLREERSYAGIYNVGGLTHDRMLISEFCTAYLQSDKSNLLRCNSEYKQSHL